MINKLIQDCWADYQKLQSIPCVLKNAIPILWFGNRIAYSNSGLKIITVALNPSDNEFHERGNNTVKVSLRFPDYKSPLTLEDSYNNYFEKNPYKSWFDSGFEPILNGMCASYYHSKGFKNIAIHTDICCPYATNPTWNDLSKTEQDNLLKDGFPLWENLIDVLDPDVIIISVRKQYVQKLGINKISTLYRFIHDKNGNIRNSPIEIMQGNYKKAMVVLGQTRNIPFGSIGKDQKIKLGEQIIKNLP